MRLPGAAACHPPVSVAGFPIRMGGRGVELAGTSFSLEGEDIRRHLTGCKSCVLLAATIGSGIEQALRRAQVTDMARAVVLDACATAAIEGSATRCRRRLPRRPGPGQGDYLAVFPRLWGYAHHPAAGVHRPAGYPSENRSGRHRGQYPNPGNR